MIRRNASPFSSLLALLVLAVLAAPAAFADDDCDEREARNARADLDGVERVLIDVGAGLLEVIGQDGTSELRAAGEACASSRDLLDEIRLETKRRGSTLIVKTEMPEGGGGWFGWGSGTARLDLRVELPKGLEVEIDDGSGSIEVRDVDLARLDDGSGSIDIRGGRVARIDDGSGSITLRGTAGDLRLTDGSGEVEIFDHEGAVSLDDGSGSITLRGIGGNVRVDDGSGSISIENVRGDVEVGDGSGSIEVEGIEGDFVVRSDGSGGVRHRDVTGRVDIPSNH